MWEERAKSVSVWVPLLLFRPHLTQNRDAVDSLPLMVVAKLFTSQQRGKLATCNFHHAKAKANNCHLRELNLDDAAILCNKSQKLLAFSTSFDRVSYVFLKSREIEGVPRLGTQNSSLASSRRIKPIKAFPREASILLSTSAPFAFVATLKSML